MTTMTIGKYAQLGPEGLAALLRVLVTQGSQRIWSTFGYGRTVWIERFGVEARRFRDAIARLQKTLTADAVVDPVTTAAEFREQNK